MSSAAEAIAYRVASELGDGEVVNLGIGIPTLVADRLRDRPAVIVQTENGMVGVGPRPEPGEEDYSLVDAGKQPITERVGAAYFSSSESFAMIRGGHVDVAVLGALQVDELGRIANWAVPGKPVLGVGGAMDLLAGAGRIIVALTHVAKDGSAKLVPECSLPLTGERRVDLIVTEHATFSVGRDGLTLEELAPESSLEWVSEHTPARFTIAEPLTRRVPG